MILTSTADACVTHVFSFTAKSATAPKRLGCREPTMAPTAHQIGGVSTHSRLSFTTRHTTSTTAQFTKSKRSNFAMKWFRLNLTPAERRRSVCLYCGRRLARTLMLIGIFKRLRLLFAGITETECQSSKQATCQTVSDVRTMACIRAADRVRRDGPLHSSPPVDFVRRRELT